MCTAEQRVSLTITSPWPSFEPQVGSFKPQVGSIGPRVGLFEPQVGQYDALGGPV